MKNNNIVHIVITIFLVQLSIQSIWGQQAESSYIYNKYGDKIVYTCVDDISHIGFLSGSPLIERETLLADLSSIADYYMLPDSSYCFTVDAGYATQFKTKAYANSHVAYCQNEYRDSLGGVVWGTNRIMVKMKPAYSIGVLVQSLNTPNLQYESKWYDTTVFALVLSKDSDLFAFSNRIFESGMVEYAQPAFYHHVSLDGYDSNPEFEYQWNLKDTTEVSDEWGPTMYKHGIDVIRAWKFTSGNPGIRIAVLDDGVLGNHEDLVDNFLQEKNYTVLDTINMVHPRKHGTQCAGIISAVNNNKGLLGVAHGCKLASLIVLGYTYNRSNDLSPEEYVIQYFSDELFEEAIHYACDSASISVFSCSWHLNGSLTETYLSAIDYAAQHGRNGKGCVWVFSSGNRNEFNPYDSNSVRPTAVLPNVLAVGATTLGGYRVGPQAPLGEIESRWESCFGDSLDLMAPGVDIITTTTDVDMYSGNFRGTSAAAPHVAGVAALVLSIDTNLTYRQVFEILCSSATKVNDDYYDYEYRSQYPYGTWNNEMGYGLVNAHHAVLKTLYRDYYVTGTSQIGLCETGSYHVHGTTPFNDSITCGWSSSPNIEILSTTDSMVARGTYPGPGWVAFNIIHDNDSLPLVFPVTVTNGGITILSNHEFTDNTTLSSPHFTDADLIIDSLATLTITDTLYIAGGRSIIVRPGGKLIVNGGTLTNACDGEMWQGIIVEGNANIRQAALAQGSVILNNATIENVREAIATRGADSSAIYEHTGGIIQATNTLFRNNRRSVEFLKYENHTAGGNVTDNVSYFTRCTFTVDNDNLFAANNTSFLEHVSMWQVRGVKFNGCTFRNETDSHSGRAIHTIEAGFTAKRVCPMPSLDPCDCNNYGNDTVRRCTFNGFSEAVHAANTLGSYAVTLDNCDFADNQTGVSLNAAGNARMSFCDFDLGCTIPTILGGSLNNTSPFTMEGNNFHRNSYSTITAIGICCDSAGTSENKIYLNDFSNLNYGCMVRRNNGGLGTTGLQFQCNSFSYCNRDIYVWAGAKIRKYQGSANVGADNNFMGTYGRSITIGSAADSIRYHRSNTGNHNPIGYTNCHVHDAGANSCASTLCGIPLYPRGGVTALEQYQTMAEEYAALAVEYEGREAETEEETSSLLDQMSDLSAQLGDLARTEIRDILNDSVPDMALLKEWYQAITAAAPAAGDIPVSAYQLAEVYSEEGDLSAARTLLSALPQQFTPDEAARNEYANYMSLQQLRETVAGNWYTMTDTDIAAMRQVAEYDNGRAARMAKEILCFFHHICYEDDPLLELDGIGERNLQGGRTDGGRTLCVPTMDDGLVIYPNPTGGTLTVESASPIREITVYDLSGRVVVAAQNIAPQQYAINVSSLQNGLYLLKAVTDSGVQTARFVKN